jgi:hypothetical protein
LRAARPGGRVRVLWHARGRPHEADTRDGPHDYVRCGDRRSRGYVFLRRVTGVADEPSCWLVLSTHAFTDTFSNCRSYNTCSTSTLRSHSRPGSFQIIGVGALVGPTLGGGVWRLTHRARIPLIEAREREFYAHVVRNRVDPSAQSASNPVPDFYGTPGSFRAFPGG